VIIGGTNLAGTSAVGFGGSAATIVGTPTTTSVMVITPTNAAGAVNVVVTTPAGNTTSANGYTYVSPSLGECHAPLVAIAGIQVITCETSEFLSVGVLSTTLVASGTNSSGGQCSNYTQPLLATVAVGILSTVVIPATNTGAGLFSPGIVGCSIRLCNTAACNSPGDTAPPEQVIAGL
jgi:hypothetical protein